MFTRVLGLRHGNPEALGFLASLAFAALASVRDVYLGGLFQTRSPLDFTLIAFGLCALLFFPVALARSPESLRLLARHPGEVLAVNATTALAWIAFFYALRVVEPSLVQLLFSGVGPLSVLWIERFLPGGAAALATSSSGPSRRERGILLGLLGTVILAAAVALTGRSALGPQPLPVAALGVGLAAVRFLGALAVAVAWRSGGAFWLGNGAGGLAGLIVAALLLIVLPIYVNQVGISLASPLTVRVVVAIGPVLILALQLVEGRLSPSPYSLGVSLAYGAFAVAATLVRRRAIAASTVG